MEATTSCSTPLRSGTNPPVSEERGPDGRLLKKAGIREDWVRTRSAFCYPVHRPCGASRSGAGRRLPAPRRQLQQRGADRAGRAVRPSVRDRKPLRTLDRLREVPGRQAEPWPQDEQHRACPGCRAQRRTAPRAGGFFTDPRGPAGGRHLTAPGKGVRPRARSPLIPRGTRRDHPGNGGRAPLACHAASLEVCPGDARA